MQFRKSGFSLKKKKPPTASVVLKLRSGATLQDAQIEAITNLVANSVEGLNPNRVAIIDDRGNVLASGWEMTQLGNFISSYCYSVRNEKGSRDNSYK